MAVALTTARMLMLKRDAKFIGVRIVIVEAGYEPDAAEDAVDYWNTV